MEQLKTVARQKGLVWRQPGTSHVTFASVDGDMLTAPAHKPIKPVYVKALLALLKPWRNRMPDAPLHAFDVRPLPEEDGGGYLVTFPNLPGCMADGESIAEAIREAADAEASWLATRQELKLPEASGRFVLRLPKSLHARLSARARQEGVSMNTLAVAFLAEGMVEKDLTP